MPPEPGPAALAATPAPGTGPAAYTGSYARSGPGAGLHPSAPCAACHPSGSPGADRGGLDSLQRGR